MSELSEKLLDLHNEVSTLYRGYVVDEELSTKIDWDLHEQLNRAARILWSSHVLAGMREQEQTEDG